MFIIQGDIMKSSNTGLKIAFLLYLLISIYIGKVWGLRILGKISPIFSIALAVFMIVSPKLIITSKNRLDNDNAYRLAGCVIVFFTFIYVFI
jgi:hypothetical protein